MTLRLLSDHVAIKTAFHGWHGLLTSKAKSDGAVWRVGDLSFKRLQSNGDNLKLDFWLRDSEHAAVQINQPKFSGSENPLSGVAIDEQGHRFLIRQAWLHKNRFSDAVRDDEFAKLTGLRPINLSFNGLPSKRQWHLVTPLDGVADSAVRLATSVFVEKCWAARTAKSASSKSRNANAVDGLSDEDREWAEGNPRLVTHLKRERRADMGTAKRRQFRDQHGRLFCERCNLDPIELFEDVDGEACIEVHHNEVAVADMAPDHKSKLSDLQCVCANCHRILHRKLKSKISQTTPR